MQSRNIRSSLCVRGTSSRRNMPHLSLSGITAMLARKWVDEAAGLHLSLSHFCPSRPSLLFLSFLSLNLANPFSPYSIQKRPEPQICPKFVPTIVFRGSNQQDPNFSKICRKIEICPEIVVLQFYDKFLRNLGPPDLNPENNRREKFWTNLGFRAFLNAVRGRKVRKNCT